MVVKKVLTNEKLSTFFMLVNQGTCPFNHLTESGKL